MKGKDEWLTVADILDDLGIPRRTWQRWRELGRTPEAIKLPNKELRIRRSTSKHGWPLRGPQRDDSYDVRV